MKILVVDDEKDVQVLFEQRFRKEIRNKEMEFVFAYSGEEALNYLNEHEHEAVLILIRYQYARHEWPGIAEAYQTKIS